jgi:hypothetical protein
MAASASIPCPELNKPEIAMTGTSGYSFFSSAIATAHVHVGNRQGGYRGQESGWI